MSLPSETQSGPETNAPAPAPFGGSAGSGWRAVRIDEWRLLALILLLFILRDMPWRLEELGQADHAFTSLEMVRAGHWWFQHLPGGAVAATGPPLTGWISAGLYYVLAAVACRGTALAAMGRHLGRRRFWPELPEPAPGDAGGRRCAAHF